MVDKRAARGGLTPKQWDYIDWLTTPEGARQPSTQVEWCRANQVAERTVRAWKLDMKFRQAWDRRLHELQIDPENVDAVIQAMHRRAVNGDTQAAKLWLDIASRFMPSHEPEAVDDDLGSLSDDELDALIAAEARAEVERRQGGD